MSVHFPNKPGSHDWFSYLVTGSSMNSAFYWFTEKIFPCEKCIYRTKLVNLYVVSKRSCCELARCRLEPNSGHLRICMIHFSPSDSLAIPTTSLTKYIPYKVHRTRAAMMSFLTNDILFYKIRYISAREIHDIYTVCLQIWITWSLVGKQLGSQVRLAIVSHHATWSRHQTQMGGVAQVGRSAPFCLDYWA